MEISVIENELSENQLEQLAKLETYVFPTAPMDKDKLSAKFACYKKWLCLMAYVGDDLVAYKIGYETGLKKFYSWIGGVHPDYRSKGIAKNLMQQQHQWCREKGYSLVQTQTSNEFKPMLILNLKSGFDIVGSFQKASERVIILEKKL